MTFNIRPLKIQIQRDLERTESWEGVSTPSDLANFIARVASVDPSSLLNLNEIVFTSIQPSGDDADKLWFKTSGSPAIGMPSNGGYKLFYQYPPYVPFIWTQGLDGMPPYIEQIESSIVTSMGLTQPLNTSFFYVQHIPRD